MSGNELVSIIIPSYNRGYILPRAVKSVLSQTYPHFELIIVDDGSTDDTEKIVQDFSDPRIKYIRHPQNKGLSAARNTGIRASRGGFVAFLDSDDEYLPEKIERSIDTFRAVSDRIGMVASNYFSVSFAGKVRHPINDEDVKRVFPHVSTWVVRRHVLEKIGFFDERIVLSEDADFFQRFDELDAERTYLEFEVAPPTTAESQGGLTTGNVQQCIPADHVAVRVDAQAATQLSAVLRADGGEIIAAMEPRPNAPYPLTVEASMIAPPNQR